MQKAEQAPEEYATFWETFGPVLKEGLYEDGQQRGALLELARFRSTRRDGWISLADYVKDMQPGQEAIYTIRGDDPTALARSPQIEGFRWEARRVGNECVRTCHSRWSAYTKKKKKKKHNQKK